MIQFSCPHCGFTMKVPPTAAGKRGKCKNCGEAVQVPRQRKAAAEESFDEFEAPQRRQSVRAQPRKRKRRPTRQQQGMATSGILGIIGLATGVLAILTSWCVFLSIPLGLMGLLLAIVGIYMAKTEGDESFGWPIAGGVASTVSLVLTVIIFSIAISSARQRGREMAEELRFNMEKEMRRIEEEQANREAQNPEDPGAIFNDESDMTPESEQ